MKNKKQINSLSFHQWTRKSFSVFNSLGKIIKISALPLTISILSIQANSLQAQEKKEVELNELQVNEQKKEVYSELSRVVTVIGKEEIAHLPVQNLQDLLEYAMSVDIRQRGTNGVQGDLSIRGGTFDQVMILLNGVNYTDPHTGHHNLNLPIDLESVERIEILQGPGSRVLGANAFSGAINIVTGSADKTGANLLFSGGQHAYLAQSANGTYKAKNATVFAAASHKQSNGFAENTDFDITNLFFQTRYESKYLGDINFQVGYQEKAFGANSFYTRAFPSQFEHTRTILSSIRTIKRIGKLTITPTVYHRRHHDRFELFRYDAPAWYAGHNYHQSDVAGTSLNLSYASKLGKTTAGADLRNESILSNRLGTPMENPVPVPYEKGGPELQFTHNSERTNLSWFLEHTVFLKKFSASAGAMGNMNSRYGNNSFFGADLSYHFTNAVSAYATVNQSLRLPTFTDLYYVGPTNLGNPDLKPEEAITYEMGFKYIKSNFKAHVAGYNRFGKNIIDWVRVSDQEKWQSLNHTNVNSKGMELSAEYLFKNSFIRNIKASYSYLDIDKESGEMLSSYVLDYMKHKVVMGLDNKIYKKISSSCRLVYQSREGQFFDFDNHVNSDYQAFALVDFRLYWNNQNITVFAEATNLLNSHYRDFGNVPQPGRWIKSGIAVRL
ncbi:MAG: TonB-dependent receptor [Bacteroidetes bacterium]|nr:TonB-dependent receptor [Bacteroidota bacterium]